MTLMTDPLTSHDITRPDGAPASARSTSATRPLALWKLAPAASRELPDYRYDPEQQVAVDGEGRPLAPTMAKDWTTYETTHTDGDGGDNETWGWEEK